MKIAFGAGLLSVCLFVSGCSLFHHKTQPAPAPRVQQQQPAPNNEPAPQRFTKPVIKADLRAWGNVVKINTDARFVVIAFEPGTVPSAGKHMNIYRNGVKVGEVNITGPQQENDIVADIVSGDIQIHDEARAD